MEACDEIDISRNTFGHRAGRQHSRCFVRRSRRWACREEDHSLTHAELYQLYGQKSWIWKEGAGYFSVQARRFIAWSKENGKPSYGVGRWFITGPGKLCFRAEWHARDGSSPATTCFSHAKRGGVIYQRREPDGAWYVFKNARVRSDDEFAKLRRGNYVGASLNRIEARLGRVE